MRSHAATCSQLPLLHLTHRHYSHTTYTIYSDGQLELGCAVGRDVLPPLVWSINSNHHHQPRWWELLLLSLFVVVVAQWMETARWVPSWGSGQLVSWLLWGFSQSSILYSCHYLCSFCGQGSFPRPAWIQRHPKIHLRNSNISNKERGLLQMPIAA